MSSDGVERLDAGAGDEDLDRTRARRGPRRTRRRPTPGRRRRPRRRARCRRRPCSSSAAAFAAGAVAVEDGDAVAVGGELAGDAEADARRATGDDGDAAHRRGLHRVELEVQLGEAAEDPGRLVVEAAGAGRAVVLLGRGGCRASGRGCARGSPGPRPGRAGRPGTSGRRARRRCGPAALGRSMRNSCRALEPPGVAVGGAVEQHDRGARP